MKTILRIKEDMSSVEDKQVIHASMRLNATKKMSLLKSGARNIVTLNMQRNLTNFKKSSR